MAITLGDAILYLKADRSQLDSGLDQARGGIMDWVGGIQGALTSGLMGAVIGGVIAGVNAAAGEQDAIVRLEAAYRATEGAVGMTVEQLRQLATQMMFTTGIEDDNFMAVEALAMTYGNISGEVMPRFLTVAADMATMFGGDLTSSARALALALSAGEDGLMRLRRQGIIFTDEQRAMIASLWESGDAMGAQNVVLSELEGRFGGTAAAALDTFHGRVQQLKTALNELMEGIGNLNIGGRTIIEWLTDATASANLIITASGRIDAAFESTRDEIAQSAASYQEYLEQTLAVAVAAGRLNQSQADLILNVRAGRTTIEEGQFGWSAYQVALELAADAGIYLTETGREAALAVEGVGASAAVARDHMSRLDDETLEVAARTGSVGDAAEQAFGRVNTALASTIRSMRDTAAWIAGGGLQLEAAAEQVNAQLLAGTITPEQADTMFQPITAAALGLQVDLNQITLSDATRQMADEFGLAWGDARTAIQGARTDILNIPAQVETAIRVAVTWNLQPENMAQGTTGIKPGGQYGLTGIVAGPSGVDNVPVNLMATAGERVTVTPEGQAPGGNTVQVGPNYVSDREDLQALENLLIQLFRGA